MIAMGGGGGGGRLGRPVLSPGKKRTSQFLPPPPHFTHPTYDIFKKKQIENIENARDIKFHVANCYISHRQ